MKYHIETQTSHSTASITQSKSAIAKAVITIDIHTESSALNQARNILLADALLSGAGTHSRAEFLEAVNLLGASIDIDTHDGRCTITLKSTSVTFPKLLRLFETMITNPTFASAEIKRIKSICINQLHQAREDSKAIAHEKLQNIFYGHNDRKYTYSIDETVTAIEKIQKTHLTKLHKTLVHQFWYATVGGDAKTVAEFSKTMKRIKQKTTVSKNTSVHQPLPPKPALSLENISSRQNIDLSIGLPVPITREHPDYLPLVFATAILGKWGGFTGRLMSTVREKEGLTYGIYAKLEGFVGDEQGHLRIMTFFSPQNTITGLTSTFREISLLYNKGVSDAELNKFKTILNTQQILLQDSLGRLLNDFHSYHFQGYSIKAMEEQKAALTKVELQAVNNAIQTYLDPGLFSVSAAGPVNSLKTELKKWHQSV